jgi:hypothetical protein
MIEGIFALLGVFIMGAFTYLSNKIQIKNKYNIEKLKIEKEQNENLRKEKLFAIKEINNIIGLFERYISLTQSVIESSIKMDVNEFHLQYLEKDKRLVDLQTLIAIYFPDLFNEARELLGLHNKYWGNQNILLRIDIKEDRNGYSSVQRSIIEIAKKASIVIEKIREDISKKTEKIIDYKLESHLL